MKNHECSTDSNKFVIYNYKDKSWYLMLYELDDELLVTKIYYCPWCGEKFEVGDLSGKMSQENLKKMLLAKVCTYCNRVVEYPESEFAMLGDNACGWRCLNKECSSKHDKVEVQRAKQMASMLFPDKDENAKWKWLKKIFKGACCERNKDN